MVTLPTVQPANVFGTMVAGRDAAQQQGMNALRMQGAEQELKMQDLAALASVYETAETPEDFERGKDALRRAGILQRDQDFSYEDGDAFLGAVLGPQGLYERKIGDQKMALAREGMDIRQEELGLRKQAASRAAASARRSAASAARAQQTEAERARADRLGRYLSYARGLPAEGRAEFLAQLPEFDGVSGPIADTEIDRALLDLGVDIPAQGNDFTTATMTRMQEIQRIMDTQGVDEATAAGIADGVIVIRNDAYNRGSIVNKVTGEERPLSIVQQTPQIPRPAAPADAPAPGGEIPDMRGGTGVEGALSNIANTASDAAGLGLVAPSNEEAARAIRTFGVEAETALASSVAGRPSNYLMQRMRTLLAEPNSIVEGSDRGAGKLRDTSALLGREIDALSDIVDNYRSYPPADVAAARAQIRRLEKLQGEADRLAVGLEGGGQTRSDRRKQGRGGVPEPSVDDLLQLYGD